MAQQSLIVVDLRQSGLASFALSAQTVQVGHQLSVCLPGAGEPLEMLRGQDRTRREEGLHLATQAFSFGAIGGGALDAPEACLFGLQCLALSREVADLGVEPRDGIALLGPDIGRDRQSVELALDVAQLTELLDKQLGLPLRLKAFVDLPLQP